MSDFGCINNQACNMNKAKNFLIDLIGRGFWGVVCVASGVDDKETFTPSFSYTVGLHTKNLPELIIFGLSPTFSAQVLNNCAQISVDKGAISNGEKLDQLANMPTIIIDVPENEKQLHAVQAYNHYRHWDFKLQQLVIPDKNCVFPWEPNFDRHMNLAQTVLGHYSEILNSE